MTTTSLIVGWCAKSVENLGPRGVRTCHRVATRKVAGKLFCTFHANKKVGNLLACAREAVKPLIEAEREAEKIGQDIMGFRMRDQ